MTTKYTLHNLEANQKPFRHPRATRPAPSPPPSSATDDKPQERPRNKATLTLKTYDPVSGTCLKYQTTEAREVGRLIAGLGSLARPICGLKRKASADDEAPSAGAREGAFKEEDSATMEVPKVAGLAEGAKLAKETEKAGDGTPGATSGGSKKKKKGKR